MQDCVCLLQEEGGIIEEARGERRIGIRRQPGQTLTLLVFF